MTTGIRDTGDFCWINMLTPRPQEACAFFTSLLGWGFTDLHGMGYRIQVDGQDVGGLFDLAGPNTPPGTPPLIGVMVKVASADATAARVTALGGKAMPAFDVMDQGRMAVCFDPNGAQFDVWEPKSSAGMNADSAHHGAPSWYETMTSDVAKAAPFYCGLFGWVPETMPLPGGDYTTFKLGEAYVAGMMPIAAEMGPMPPHWGTYFTVTDVDASLAQAVTLGAKVCIPAQDIPNVGRFGGITSPQGVTFYVITYAPQEA